MTKRVGVVLHLGDICLRNQKNIKIPIQKSVLRHSPGVQGENCRQYEICFLVSETAFLRTAFGEQSRQKSVNSILEKDKESFDGTQDKG